MIRLYDLGIWQVWNRKVKNYSPWVMINFNLAIAALFFAVIIGVPMGIFAAIKHNSPADQIVMSVTMIGISIPSFRLGLILILVMSVGLRLLPSCGYAVVNLIVDVLYAFIDPRIKY